MIYTTLGKTEMKVGRIGFGGIPIQRLSYSQSDRVIETALALGINFFDTARGYTDSEEKFGRILSKKRKEVYIATKSFSRQSEKMAEDLNNSLKNLQTDYLDVYFCHNIASREELDRIMLPNGVLKTMQRWKKEGKIRYIGLSGHKPWIVKEAMEKFPFDVIQFPFNYIEDAGLEALIPAATARGVGRVAMKPMAGGALQNLGLNLRFILTSGVEVAIPGMDSRQQVEENHRVLNNLAPLTQVEKRKLEKEKKELGKDFCRRCEYCMPCPQGLPISFLHVLRGYYFRYGLKEWVWQRLDSLKKTFADCTACGQCREKCPYELDSAAIFAQTWQVMQQEKK